MGSSSDGCKKKGTQRRNSGDFIKLIHEETMLVHDPLFSKESVDQYTDKKSSKQDNSKKRISGFATNSKSDKEEKRDVQTRDPVCIACHKDHLLDSCKICMEKTLKERTKLLANKKLCYGCYQPMTSITIMPKPASKDCFTGYAKSTIQQEYMLMSRKLLKKILSPKMALKIQ